MRRILISAITVLAFFVSLLTPKAALANPWAVMNDGVGEVAPMKAGDKAPFAGVLFSTEAAAKIQVEKQFEEMRCEIKVEKEVNLAKAKLELRLANERASREAAQQKLEAVRSLKEDQIKFLNSQLVKHEKKNKRDLTGVWVASGVVGGVLITVLAGIALNQAGKI